MNIKFTGKCIDAMTDKRGTLYLIIEDGVNGTPTPQKVKCWGRGIDAAARAIRKGDLVQVEAKLGANRWDPGDGRPPMWFDGLQATFIEVKNSHAAGSREQPDDGDLPF